MACRSSSVTSSTVVSPMYGRMCRLSSSREPWTVPCLRRRSALAFASVAALQTAWAPIT